MLNGPLFSGQPLHEVFEYNLTQAREAVTTMPEGRLNSVSDENLIDHVFSAHELEPLELSTAHIEMEPKECMIDVRHDSSFAVFDRSKPQMAHGMEIIVSVPYTGESSLWGCAPSVRSLNPPRAKVRASGDRSGSLDVIIQEPFRSGYQNVAIKNRIDRTITEIGKYLARINSEVRLHNQALKTTIECAVTERRERLGRFAAITSMLNIPIKRREETPDVQVLPIRRKLVKPLRIRPSLPPEPGILPEHFEHILSVIRHEGRSFETSPETFSLFGEEGLRDIILAHLNGHYEGAATGETFRKSGKTDIRIENDNRSAFVAECKVWRGQAKAGDALNQILGYLTWRDCKAALIYFNTNIPGFMSLHEKLCEALSGHAYYEATLDCNQEGEWRFRFHSAEDTDHKIVLHVFFFNLYSPKSKRGSE